MISKRWRVAAAAVLLAAAGCGGWKNEAIEAAQQRDEDAQKTSRLRLQKRIDDLAAEIQKSPLDVNNNKIEADKIAADADLSGLGDKFRPDVEKLKKDADDAFAKVAEDRSKEAIAESKKLAAAGKLKEAKDKITKLPLTVRMSKHWPACEEELAHLEQLERTEAVWTRNSARADQFKQTDEPEKARGVIEAFLALAEAIPTFKESPHVKDADAALKALAPAVEKARTARATEAAIPWIPALSGRKDDLAKWELGDPQNVNFDGEKICVFKYSGDEPQGKGMMYGDDDWEDYVVEATINLGGKGKVYLNLHGGLENGERNWKDVCELKDFEVPRGKWVKIRLEARNGDINLLCNGATTSIRGKKAKLPKGPFEFRVLPGGELKIKDVFVKVYKPAKSGK